MMIFNIALTFKISNVAAACLKQAREINIVLTHKM